MNENNKSIIKYTTCGGTIGLIFSSILHKQRFKWTIIGSFIGLFTKIIHKNIDIIADKSRLIIYNKLTLISLIIALMVYKFSIPLSIITCFSVLHKIYML